jgi:hypothetical protein
MELIVAAFLKSARRFLSRSRMAEKKDEPVRMPAVRAAFVAMAWSGGLLKGENNGSI